MTASDSASTAITASRWMRVMTWFLHAADYEEERAGAVRRLTPERTRQFT